MVKLFAPGLDYYVQRIEQGTFSFQRYHDGEWKAIVPGAASLLFPPQRIVWSIEKECAILRNTVLKCHRHPNYMMAMFTEIVSPRFRPIQRWIAANAPRWIKWHNDKVFQNAALGGRLFPFVQAIKRQSLPVVIVGPQYLSRMPLNVTHHIVTPPVEEWPRLWYERDRIKEAILALGKPAFISFSAGMAVNVLIHELWPVIGCHSYMIDVGSLWDGLCGKRNRGWHHRLGKRNIWKSLYGK